MGSNSSILTLLQYEILLDLAVFHNFTVCLKVENRIKGLEMLTGKNPDFSERNQQAEKKETFTRCLYYSSGFMAGGNRIGVSVAQSVGAFQLLTGLVGSSFTGRSSILRDCRRQFCTNHGVEASQNTAELDLPEPVKNSRGSHFADRGQAEVEHSSAQARRGPHSTASAPMRPGGRFLPAAGRACASRAKAPASFHALALSS